MFHELTTLLAEAESILNSRTLWPLHSTDPEDPLVLTAGHFLIGRPLKSPPTPGADLKTDVSKLKRWNLDCNTNYGLPGKLDTYNHLMQGPSGTERTTTSRSAI